MLVFVTSCHTWTSTSADCLLLTKLGNSWTSFWYGTAWLLMSQIFFFLFIQMWQKCEIKGRKWENIKRTPRDRKEEKERKKSCSYWEKTIVVIFMGNLRWLCVWSCKRGSVSQRQLSYRQVSCLQTIQEVHKEWCRKHAATMSWQLNYGHLLYLEIKQLETIQNTV